MKLRPPALALLAALSALPAFAQTADELKSTNQQLEKSRARARELAAQAVRLEEEQRALSRELVRMGADIRRNEEDLSAAEEKLSTLSRQLDEKNVLLKEQRDQLAAMVRASISLSEMPPEAAVMMPGDPGRIIEAARAVQLMASSMREKSDRLAAEMKELFALKASVEETRASLQAAQSRLKQDQQAMNEKLKARAELFARANDERQQQQKRAADLAQKSQDLQALLSQIEKERREKEAEAARAAQAEADAKAKAAQETKKRKARSFATAKGELHLPVAGKFYRGFGTINARGEKRKGIVLKARPGAQVTAPYDGEVVFTGPFLNYGKIVIIRHGGDYHTLLAGFERISAQTGAAVLQGEPLGAMDPDDDAPQLYMELRKDNQPINPAPWIAGLSEKDD